MVALCGHLHWRSLWEKDRKGKGKCNSGNFKKNMKRIGDLRGGGKEKPFTGNGIAKREGRPSNRGLNGKVLSRN